MNKNITIRKYEANDCFQTYQLFYDTVHYINIKDYTSEQINVWAKKINDLSNWNDSLLNHYSIVACIDNQIVGFADIDDNGYLDRLYVHHKFQKQKIATLLCDHLEKYCPTNISTHASITAKPFFEKRGYQTIKKQQVIRENIALTNYIMIKQR